MRTLRITVILALAAVLCFTAIPAWAAETAEAAVPETNTEFKADLYPYVVHGETADWYIAQADIDLLGIDGILSGIGEIMPLQEADFADARDFLAPYLDGDVPKVRICTDFSGHAEVSKVTSAYYNGRTNFIKLFHNWTQCRASLLHEYVHYLTIACAKSPVRAWFWSEGVAEYVSRFVCKNRMSRSVNTGADEAYVALYREKGAWDSQEDCVDEKLLFFGLAELFRRGDALGESYTAVNNQIVERTEKIQQDQTAETISYYEAGSMVAFLVDRFGEEYVLSRWDGDPEKMEEDFGADFRQLYREWAEWNTEQCRKNGLDMD